MLIKPINRSNNNTSTPFHSLKVDKIYTWTTPQLDTLFSSKAIREFADSLDQKGYDVVAKKFEFVESSFFGLQKKKKRGLALSIQKQDENNLSLLNIKYFKEINKAIKKFDYKDAIDSFVSARFN